MHSFQINVAKEINFELPFFHSFPMCILASNYPLSSPHTHTHITEVFKESAYVYALSLAVITHTITKACAQGLLESCPCDEGPTSYDGDIKQKHCSDEYALQIAESFLRLRDTKKGKDLKDELFDHNIEAAKHVSD